jgi:hypothetical protein
MKKTPQLIKLEKMLRASKFSAHGFLGDDKRNIYEIIDADAAMLTKLGYTRERVARRMEEISESALNGLGSWVQINDSIKARANDTRGKIPCPFGHGYNCSKTIIMVEQTDKKKSIQWSYMNIHLIKEHGFFEGKGAEFRIDPRELVEVIF